MLENLEALEKSYQHGWILSTSQLSELLNIKVGSLTIKPDNFERHGFTFTRDGEVGTEKGWRVGKAQPAIADNITTKRTRKVKIPTL